MPELRQTWRIEVQAEGAGPSLAIRVRHLLKAALRGYGLRCISVEEVRPTEEKTADGGTDGGLHRLA